MIGVLAIQGAFREHVAALRDAGAAACEVRTVAELAAVDALVIPGGESTTMRMGLERAGLTGPLRARLVAGMPALGTCAGLVVLARLGAPDVAPPPLGLLDVTVARNGFGRQPFSFETAVEVSQGVSGRVSDAGVVASTAQTSHDETDIVVVAAGDQAVASTTTMHGVFIRAPRIESVGAGVEVIGRIAAGTHSGEPVIVRQGLLVGCTFHPELTADRSLHRYFVRLVEAAIVAAPDPAIDSDTMTTRQEAPHGWA
ncbi:MAG: pyridoxal 5'-phosphate synthase glutaminase subunit PdxT [Thermoleophilia bacterium]|nr:pyridoxal 5'-phosphate synthase glutaminase subunit PdxT [Thermoleophilia bacterium]